MVYAPLEDKVAAYGTLELALLVSELSGCPIPAEPATCAEDLISMLNTASKAAFTILGQAVSRCIGFTGVFFILFCCQSVSLL